MVTDILTPPASQLDETALRLTDGGVAGKSGARANGKTECSSALDIASPRLYTPLFVVVGLMRLSGESVRAQPQISVIVDIDLQADYISLAQHLSSPASSAQLLQKLCIEVRFGSCEFPVGILIPGSNFWNLNFWSIRNLNGLNRNLMDESSSVVERRKNLTQPTLFCLNLGLFVILVRLIREAI